MLYFAHYVIHCDLVYQAEMTICAPCLKEVTNVKDESEGTVEEKYKEQTSLERNTNAIATYTQGK